MNAIYLREETRKGIGRVAVFSDTEVVIESAQELYFKQKRLSIWRSSCRLIDAIFNEAALKNKPKLIDYVA